MGKKKHAEEHENLERWLVSYADFITLLFATFVVLYALAQVDLQKLKQARASIREAFTSNAMLKGQEGVMNSNGVMDSNGESILNSGMNPSMLSVIEPMFEAYLATREDSLYKEVKSELEREIEKEGIEGVEIKITERGLVIDLLESLMFESGSAFIKPASFKALDKVGELIKAKFSKTMIRIEGHTDNIPINTEKYPSNWELSSARASSVLRYLLARFNLNKENYSAIGYGDSRPLKPNLNEEGRKLNRRVEIIVLRRSQAKFEPKAQHKEQKIGELDKNTLEAKKKSHHGLNLNPFAIHSNNNHADNNHSDKHNEAQVQSEPPSQAPGVSSAALELMKNNNAKPSQVLILKDSYDKQSLEIQNKLKQIENPHSSGQSPKSGHGHH